MELDIEHHFLFILQAMFKKTQSLKNIVKKLGYRDKIEYHYKIGSVNTNWHATTPKQETRSGCEKPSWEGLGSSVFYPQGLSNFDKYPYGKFFMFPHKR